MSSARILAVDDDANHLAALKRDLRRSQFEVETATNGRIGLRMAMRDAPDLVLLDVSMPCMSGYEFLRRFRRLEARGAIGGRNPESAGVFSRTPVIFLTGLATPHQQVSGLNAGAVDYITKPHDPDELRARIRSQLRSARQREDILTFAGLNESPFGDVDGDQTAVVRKFGRTLAELEAALELIDHVDDIKLRRRMLDRAKHGLWTLTLSLAHLTRTSLELEKV